jgi:hypothetical protein
MFDPRRIAALAAANVELNPAESRRFRVANVRLAFVPLLIAWITAVWSLTPGGDHPLWKFLGVCATGAACTAIFLWLATGTSGLFAIAAGGDTRLANRGRILADYACAAVSWMALPAALGCAAAVIEHRYHTRFGSAEWIPFAAATAAEVTVWFIDVIAVLRDTAKPTRGRLILAGLALILWWAFLGTTLLATVPMLWTFGPAQTLRLLWPW